MPWLLVILVIFHWLNHQELHKTSRTLHGKMSAEKTATDRHANAVQFKHAMDDESIDREERKREVC